MPQPTDTQLANRLNPTPVTYNIPTTGLWRAVGDDVGSNLYRTNADGTISQYNIGSLASPGATGQSMWSSGQQNLKSQYGIDFSSLPTYNYGDVFQQAVKSGTIKGYQNPDGQFIPTSGISQGKFSDLVQAPPGASATQTTVNNTPNSLGDIAGATAAQTQQLAGDQGMNVTQTTTPEGVAAVTKTPLGTPAAQTQPSNGAGTPAPSSAGTAGSAINYQKLPNETIDQYNARIAASGGPSAPTGTSTGAAGAIDTNYQMKPGETIDSYNARIAAYNASKPVTQPTGQPGASGTMAQTGGANDPYAGLDPIQKQVKMYTDAYNALGLNTIKQQFDDYAKQQADLTDEMNKKIQDSQNNPWLSQGIVDKTVQRIKDSYATQLDTLTHLLTLTDSLYKQGQAQVETIVSNANADIKATNDLAQKQIDAANALAKDNSVHTELVNGVPHDLLINNATGKTVADLGPSASTANSGFTLSAGQTRYDANGNPVASVAPKPTSSSSGGGTNTTDPVTQAYITAVANGNATMQQVPTAYRNAVALGLANAPASVYTPLAASRFTTAANRIVSNFTQLPQYQLTANGLPYLERIAAAMQSPGSISDQDLLDSLTKLNTSGNAISDAQVRLITDGRSFADAINVFANKLSTGGVLSNTQRNQIQTIAQNIYANYQKGYQPVYDQVTSQLQAAGIPKAFWTIPDLNTLATQGGYGNYLGSSASSGTSSDVSSLAAQYGI